MTSAAFTLLSLLLAATINAQSGTTDAVATGTTASPSGPVLTVTFPGGVDPQILVGSVVGTASSLTTVVITCPEGTDPNDCGFSPPVTFTQGPSTAAFVYNDHDTYVISETCQFSAGNANCVVTEIGQGVNYGTDASGVGTALSSGTTTVISTVVLNGTDIATADVTITAGQFAGVTGSTSETGSSSTGRSSSGSHPTSRASSSHTGASSTSSSNDVAVLVPGSLAMGIVGLAALLL